MCVVRMHFFIWPELNVASEGHGGYLNCVWQRLTNCFCSSSFPASPGPFLSFVSETLNFYSQQRSACHPVVVHCLSGVGRTGLFCLVTAAVCDIQAGRGLLDLVTTTACMSTHRKGSLRDREHLKFAYQTVLYYAQDLLMKREWKVMRIL
jgi:tyrosine-protein phosphatase non-receptor type 23